MKLIVGIITVFVCVLGGYAAMGGKLGVLWQPFEGVIILGAALGAFIIANPGTVIKQMGGAMGTLMKGSPYNKDSYLELLSCLFQFFKLAKAKGNLALEAHVENPHDSEIFKQFPSVASDHHAVDFICDYIRLITLGTENPHEMEALMDEELETHHNERHQLVDAMQALADGTPALGIVAAVLGVIKTMGSINEPPEVLGKLIGGALVGTFLGVFVAYGFFAPMTASLKATYDAEAKYYQCIKAAILAHLSGYPPAVSVEFGRNALLSDTRPTFAELEEKTGSLPQPA